jgi:sulfur relay (sulfurtransferase) DsrC/TusE family protein
MAEEEKEDNKKIRIFQGKKVRTHWDDDKEKWYFSIVDVIAILTDSDFQVARNYWKVLKFRLAEEGNESVTNCNQLKMLASDGKYYLTDVGDTEQIFRLIQSIPSKKAEPFKLWLARVGSERIDETHNPELAIDRAMKTYLKKGYSKEWINQRLKTIEVRKELTDEWERVGIQEEQEFAILTDEITKAWSDLSIKDYKILKNLKKENLRDNMTNLELVLNMLAEVTTKEFSKKENPEGFSESVEIARKGGSVAGNARREIESVTGESVVSDENFLDEPEKLKKKRKRMIKQVAV